MRTSRVVVLPVLAVLLLPLSATGCGGDDPAADTPAGDLGTSPTGGLDTDVLDEAPADRLVEALGTALVSVLPDAAEYRFDGGRLVVEMAAGQEAAESTCAIASTARDGIGADVPITLSYDGDEVDCP